jgi:hypothetical protein
MGQLHIIGSNSLKKSLANFMPLAALFWRLVEPIRGHRQRVLGLPFSSQHLRDAADKVIHQGLNGEELWAAEGLQIPAYRTENGRWSKLLSYSLAQLYSLSGSDLQSQTGSLTHSVFDQTFTKALCWPKVTDLPEGATHAVYFGAGGISGIGPLNARNLDERGVRVIDIGEKGKGDAEFYLERGVRKEPSWIKKWAPLLAKTR